MKLIVFPLAALASVTAAAERTPPPPSGPDTAIRELRPFEPSEQQCRDRITVAREAAGKPPLLEREPASPEKPYHIYAVDKRVASDIESLLHKFFAAARIDVQYERDGEKVAAAREWFSVPVEAIDEAVQLIAAGTIINYTYDKATQRIVLRS